jgi:hypothetical protein
VGTELDRREQRDSGEIRLKTALVIPSIQRLDSLRGFLPELHKYNAQIIIVDEGEQSLRDYNSKILDGLEYDFYGPNERADALGPDVDVIPTRCHAETSFGFWVAHELGAEVVVELDDDCWGKGLVTGHLENLSISTGTRIGGKSQWFNPLLNMNKFGLFPRGYPYDSETREKGFSRMTRTREGAVLNMGLWNGQPDLDAATILSLGGLNGRAESYTNTVVRKKIIVDRGTFFPICSMNTSFRAEIIPAFYQMYMNYEGLDRYCDIWSGLFIKKICDHLGKNVSLGQPVVEHRKTERSTFKDLRAEHEGMAINETLWKVVRDMQLEGKTYYDVYDSLIQCLNDSLFLAFTDKLHNKMLQKQVEKMTQWLELFE